MNTRPVRIVAIVVVAALVLTVAASLVEQLI